MIILNIENVSLIFLSGNLPHLSNTYFRLMDRAGGFWYWDILESFLHLDGVLLCFPRLCDTQSSRLNTFPLLGALSRSLVLDVDSSPTLPTPTITGNIMEEDAKKENTCFVHVHIIPLQLQKLLSTQQESIWVSVESSPFNILLHNV